MHRFDRVRQENSMQNGFNLAQHCSPNGDRAQGRGICSLYIGEAIQFSPCHKKRLLKTGQDFTIGNVQ